MDYNIIVLGCCGESTHSTLPYTNNPTHPNAIYTGTYNYSRINEYAYRVTYSSYFPRSVSRSYYYFAGSHEDKTAIHPTIVPAARRERAAVQCLPKIIL